MLIQQMTEVMVILEEQVTGMLEACVQLVNGCMVLLMMQLHYRKYPRRNLATGAEEMLGIADKRSGSADEDRNGYRGFYHMTK